MNRAKLLCYGIVAAASIAMGCGSARADIITFDVSGTMKPLFGSASCAVGGCLLGGDIVIDNVTGNVISANVTTTGFSPAEGPFTNPSSLHTSGGFTDLEIATAPTFTAEIALLFTTPTLGSLVGYTGGALATDTTIRPQTNTFGWNLVDGSLTATTVVETPEPSSLLLLFSAFAGLSVVGLFRKRLLPARTA
jgi:hypothetical protein